MVEQVEFKDFRIGELFEIFTIPQIPRNFMLEIKESKLSDEFFPYITQKKNDNGIAGYIRKTNILPLTQKPVILLGVDNVSNGVCFYHNEPFYANKMIALHHEKLNKKTALYFISCILKQYSNYSYSRKISLEIIKRTKIPLPVTSSGTPDYSYMESYISYIEKLHISRIEQILKELGYNSLKDVELTQEDKEILRLFSGGGEKLTLAEFKIGELFDIKSTKKVVHSSSVELHNDKTSKEKSPYVVRSALNNGIRGYSQVEDSWLNPGNSISFAQDTFSVFYQEEPYFTGNKVKVMELKGRELNRKIALYFVSLVSKAFSGYGWSTGSTSQEILNKKIPLPINPQSPETPNYSLMESYITAIEKLHVNKLISSHTKEITALNTVT